MEYIESGPECPFCGFQSARGDYDLLLHIEEHHPDDEPPATVAEETFPCPQDGCDELLTTEDVEYHLQLHELEAGNDAAAVLEEQQLAPPDDHVGGSSRSSREGSRRRRHEKHRSTSEKGWSSSGWKAFFFPPKANQERSSSTRKSHKSKGLTSSKPDAGETTAQSGGRSRQFIRLGRSELGRFAHEKEMPAWLIKLLQEEGQVVNAGVMPVLGQLLQQCPSTQVAYLCHPQVQHVSKLRREGGFCGYRNVQMLISHIIGAQTTGSELFGPTFPSIFEIQDLIENAWDMDINAQGRIETGGIKGTRKYIGTPEAQAVFLSLSIPCSVQAFKDQERGKARATLLEAIERYFQSGVTNIEDRIHFTGLPPIYLQHPRHSLTIVGLERQVDGEVSLLVFDPSFQDSIKIRQLVGKMFRHKMSKVDEAVEPYRRGSEYLNKFKAFELLYLNLDHSNGSSQ